MIFYEMYPTEARKDKIKKGFKKELFEEGSIAPFFEVFQKGTFPQLQRRIDSLAHIPLQQREPEYVSLKRSILELKILIHYLLEVEKELGLPSSPNDPSLLLTTCDALIASVDFYQPSILAWRKKVLPTHFEKQVEMCLAKIAHYAKEDPSIASEHRENFLATHEKEIRQLALHFANNFDRFEKQVLEQVRGILIMETPESVFQLLYSFSGALYIVIEASGHFLGAGAGKLSSRAFLLQTAETVALIRSKMIFPEEAKKDKQVETQKEEFYRALDESDLLLQLKATPGIVSLQERILFEKEGIHHIYLIEDYYPSGTLAQAKELPPDTKKEIAKSLLTGLFHLHSHQIIHHDISPDNVLLDLLSTPPRAALADFNSAFHLARRPLTGFIQIKWGYSPPEYAKIMRQEDPTMDEYLACDPKKVDIWGAGTVLYTLFFNAPLPWEEKSREETLAEIDQLPVHWIPSSYKKSPYFTLIESLLTTDPTKRPTAEKALKTFLSINIKTT